MRTAILSLFVLLPAIASAQQGMQSYTPEAKTDAPTFMNAEVVRVNRDNTATFRSESGEITLTADDSATAALGTLHAGDKVLVGYREVKGADGRVTRYVTSVKAASPDSGESGRRAVSARLTKGSTVRGRVLSFDQRHRRVTLIDESGGLRALPVRSGIGGLDALVPGSNVAFNVGAGTGSALTVTGITPLGDTPVFANNNAFPGVSAQFVSFNAATGVVTLDTTTAGRLTFPVSSTMADSFGGLRRGDTLSFGFDVTTGQTKTGTTTFTPAPVVTITGFQPLTTASGAVGAIPAVLPTGVVGGQAVGATPVSNTEGGPVVSGGTAAGSPYLKTVPSIPSGTPVTGAVLPPAGAKEPLSAGDVGLMRAQGERDLDASAVALAAAAAAIDPMWAGFKNQCLSGFSAPTVTSGREWYLLAEDRVPTPPDDACRAMHADVKGRAMGFLSQLQTVEDAARKADVLPARVREVLDRHKL